MMRKLVGISVVLLLLFAAVAGVNGADFASTKAKADQGYALPQGYLYLGFFPAGIAILIGQIPAVLIRWVILRRPTSTGVAIGICFTGWIGMMIILEVMQMKSTTLPPAVAACSFFILCWGSLWRGASKPTKEGEKLHRKAADQRLARAQNNVGLKYSGGLGVTKDEAEAVKWYRKAADLGDARAQFNLGNMYGQGRGMTKDETEAVKWYRKAAEQGIADAQRKVGYCYAYGLGVTKDDVQAYMWYLLAGSNGNEDAKKNYGIMEKQLTAQQRADGQRMAREWKPGK
jgi:hypothetical protein